MRIIAIALIVLIGLGALAVHQRHAVIFMALGSGEPPPLLDQENEGTSVRWFDDYYTIEALDERTFAIGEPRYYQQVFSYLITGTQRAVLFDAGPGYHDIRPVAESLTDLPITFIPSHFHFDHTGNTVTFEDVAVVDLPGLRDRAPDNKLPLTRNEHLGHIEGVENITLEVDNWIAPGSELDLGGRTLRVLLTPGHTEESISLLDAEAQMLFAGDFICPCPLFAFLPNSSMGDYVQGTDTVIAAVGPEIVVHGAHRMEPPGSPKQSYTDLVDLQSALDGIRNGEVKSKGLYPVIYPVNDEMEIWAEPKWLQDWTPTHPAQ